MNSESNNTQYTVDTLVPVSKNFLKKTLIKHEATKKANKELIELCKKSLAKKNFEGGSNELNKEIIEKNKILEKELYEKNKKIEILKFLNKRNIQQNNMKENKIKNNMNYNKTILEENILEENIIKDIKYIEAEKQYNFIKKILLEPIKIKKDVLMIYKDINDINSLNIDIYNILSK